MENSQEYQSAKKRVEARMGFNIHLFVYIAVISLLMIINLTTSRDSLWFQWPMMGWGIAVVIHGLSIFVFPNLFSVDEKKIQREMKKHHK